MGPDGAPESKRTKSLARVCDVPMETLWTWSK